MAWLPLESNPEVMNKYLHNLGVPPKYEMVDVYSLDDDSLATIPRPVLALLLLFPCNAKYKEFKKEQEDEINEKGQEISKNVFYMKQTISNACGTIALIHSIANNSDKIKLDDGHLKTFLEESKELSPDARAELFEKADGIKNIHKELAQEGQTEIPPPNQPINEHFIAFIQKDDHIYELDGSKSFPINHGPTKGDSFLQDAAWICKKYMERDPDELRFTVMALVPY